jgi:hypothetical protein
VASIAVGFEKGNRDNCELVDGSIEGWGFQQGYVPSHSSAKDEEDAARKHEARRRSPGRRRHARRGSPGAKHAVLDALVLQPVRPLAGSPRAGR